MAGETSLSAVSGTGRQVRMVALPLATHHPMSDLLPRESDFCKTLILQPETRSV